MLMLTITLRCRYNARLVVLATAFGLATITQFAVAQDELSDAELEKLIQTQVQQLSSGELETRRKACEELNDLCETYESRAKHCVPALVKCLAEEDERIANFAMWGLTNCGPPAVKPLIECLTSKNPLARKNTATTIFQISWTRPEVNVEEARAPLRKLLGDPDASVRQESAAALGQIGDTDPSTVDQLVELVKSSIVTDRIAGLRTMFLFRHNEEVRERVRFYKDVIVQSLQDEESQVRIQAIVALEVSGLAPTDMVPLFLHALEDSTVDVRGAAVSGFLNFPNEIDRSAAVPKLIQLLGTDQENLTRVCELLGKIGPKAKEAVPALRKALQSLEVSVVASAAKALWLIDKQSDDAIAALERFLQRGNLTDGEIICDTIGTIGPAAAPLTKYVVKLLKSGDWDVQWAAADALGVMAPNDAETLGVLVDFLGHDSNLVAGSSAEALAHNGVKAVPALIEATRSGSARQREYAADALGRMGPAAKDAVEPLKKLLKSEHRPCQVWSAIALAKIDGSADVVPVLIEALLEDESVSTRRQAAVALGKIGVKAKAAIPALRAALKEEDEGLQQAADEALEMIEK
jgi:HEAT repeat protein